MFIVNSLFIVNRGVFTMNNGREQRCGNAADAVWVSAISAWEVSLKAVRETLVLVRQR